MDGDATRGADKQKARRQEAKRLAALAKRTIAAAADALATAETLVAALPSAEDGRRARHAIKSARDVQWLLGQMGADMLAADMWKRAIDGITAACVASATGADPFPKLFDAAGLLSAAVIYCAQRSDRSEKASPKVAASRRLRALAKSNPDMSAAALRRMVEREAGGRMDESAARAVVRQVRRQQRDPG